MAVILGLSGFPNQNVDGQMNIKIGGKMTGGGWLASTGATGKANFGFNAKRCAIPGPIDGRFNYHDKKARAPFQPGGVKMNGPVIDAGLCADPDTPPRFDNVPGPVEVNCMGPCFPGQFFVEVGYTSKNRKFPGGGTVVACVTDTGEGTVLHGVLNNLVVQSGPYVGYYNAGPLSGNIQFHTCTCTDGIDNDGDGPIDAADSDCIDPITGAYDPNRDED